MRIAVVGTGAVGGYFGAKLAASGNPLFFLARGQQLAALRSQGLRIESSDGALWIRDALFTDNAAAIGIVDLVLFCVKSYDTEAALRMIAPLIGAKTAIVSLQNGVDNPEKIASRWGGARAYAGVVYIGALVTSPGIIVHSSGGKIVYGPMGQPNHKSETIAETFSAAGIPCAYRENIVKLQWGKLLWNAPFCAISCLARADVQQILQSRELKKLALDCMAEVRQAALTRGIELPPSLFNETLAFSAGLGNFKPSMLQDLEAGKPLEYEALNGVVVHLLRQAGTPAPINETFCAVLKHLDQQSRQEAARRQ